MDAVDHEAVAFYQEHGWYVTGQLIPDDLVTAAAETLRKLESAPRDRNIPASLRDFLAWEPGQPRPVRQNQYIALQYQTIAAVAQFPEIARFASALTGSSLVRIFNTALISKKPGVESRFSEVGWHTDQAYWKTCSSERMITAWVPFQDTTAEMGTLTLVDGSHLWPDTPEVQELRAAKTFMTRDHADLRRKLAAVGVKISLEEVQLRKGQVSFHHPLTFHGSGVNRTSIDRNAMSIHFQDGDNHYRPTTDSGEIAETYVHDEFVRRTPDGAPDYADPEFCPVVWPPPNPLAPKAETIHLRRFHRQT